MIRALFAFASAAVLVTGTAQAQSFNVKSPAEVVPVSGNTFFVAGGGRFGARGTWCSAANYVLKQLGAPGTTDMYVLEASDTNSGRILFGTDPAGLQPRGVTSVAAALKVPGSTLSANQAFTFCSDVRLKYRR